MRRSNFRTHAVLGLAGALAVATLAGTSAAADPSGSPSETPSQAPSDAPSETPSETPSEAPSETPSETSAPAPAPVAAKGNPISFSNSKPIAGEYFNVNGRLTTKGVRKVILQEYNGKRWVNVRYGKSTSSGSFSIRHRTFGGHTYRGYAPKSGSLGAQYTGQAFLKPVKQTGYLRMLPQLSDPGATIKKAQDAKSVMVGSAQPYRPGRRIALQRLQGSKWVWQATQPINRYGEANFVAPYKYQGSVATYRSVPQPVRGAPSVTSSAVKADANGYASWTEAFNGNKLSPQWKVLDSGFQEDLSRGCSKPSGKASTVRGGQAYISVVKDWQRANFKCTARNAQGESLGKFSWRLNGNIGTQRRVHFKYGFAAARIKLHHLRGQHGAFWLWPNVRKDGFNNPGKTGNEVDITEWFGKQSPPRMENNIYWRGKGGRIREGGALKNPDQYLSGKGDSWWGRYHVFSVEWTPKRYIFRIDGKESFRTYRGVSHQREFVRLSLISSDYELPLISETDLPQSMNVDWVRVWSKDAIVKGG